MDRLYAAPTADVQWQNDPDLPNYNPQPPQSVYAADDGGTITAYLVGEAGFTDWDAIPNAYIVGSWDRDTGLQEGQTYDNGNVIGTPTYTLQPDYLAYIRPLGNESGRATGLLDSIRWAGHPEQKFLQDDHRYPATDSPFTLEIIREDIGADAPLWDSVTPYDTGDYVQNPLGTTWQALQDNIGQTPFGGSPFWEFINTPGWGWSVVMLSDDPQRDITARAIGVYSQPGADPVDYLYTTGAFVQDGSHGNNFFSECPAGQRTATPEQVNFALLLGSAPEGWWVLTENGEDSEALFWSHSQP